MPYAKQVLNAGKHVLVEKPFAPTSKEAKEVIKSGKLGDVVRFESHYDYYKPNGWNQLPALYNLGVHTTDQVISLFGMPDKVEFDARSLHNPGTDDYYDLNFYYGKCKATVSTSMCVLIDYPRFTVHGTKGSLILPPAVHGSGKKKVVGRHAINFVDPGEERWAKWFT